MDELTLFKADYYKNSGRLCIKNGKNIKKVSN
jgi:hypothetical protein